MIGSGTEPSSNRFDAFSSSQTGIHSARNAMERNSGRGATGVSCLKSNPQRIGRPGVSSACRRGGVAGRCAAALGRAATGAHRALRAGLRGGAGPFSGRATLRIEFLIAAARHSALHMGLALRTAANMRVGRRALRQTGPASMADIASAIAEAFTNFIHFSQVLTAMNGRLDAAPSAGAGPAHRADQYDVTNGAVAMQTAPCGYRAGISGSFRESLATYRPHMRQLREADGRPHTSARCRRGNRAAFLFCRETARYYHRLLAAT